MHRDDEEAAEHETATEKEASRDDESSLEELVANVVVVDEDEPDTPDSASIGYAVAESLDAKRSKPKSKAKRSRKPRRATRTFREPQREETSEGSSAKHGKRDEHAGAEKASNQRSEQTYDEAVEAFEKSPRRKRRTRGNSRSDIRPKREDFAQDETPAKDAQLATSKKEAKAERKGAEPGENASVRATRSRGRRRVVRKMAQSQSTPASNERGQGSEAQRRESSAQTTASKARKGGRGRRRVARRRSR